MKISIFLLLSIFVVLPCLVYSEQAEGNESLRGADNGNNGELDPKNEEVSNEDEKDAKPRKTSFKEERFEKLFNNRHRKPRLTAPKYHQKPKAKLPSFIKNPPNIKPLGQDGLPVDDVPRPTQPSVRAKQQTNARATIKTTTTTPRSRARITSTSTTTTPKPSISDSNKRFSSSSRGRLSSSSNSIPSTGRSRLN